LNWLISLDSLQLRTHLAEHTTSGDVAVE
jgi:hypothetical protein